MKPKILLLDIETFPQLGYTWVSYETNVIAIKEPWSICCFSAKWLGGIQITKALPDYKAEDDSLLVQHIWHLVDEADIVVAHNGDQFDIKKINARFLVHNLPPPRPFQTVDTKKVAKRAFGFTSNKLDSLCQQLGIGKKIPVEGFSLWEGCMAGNSASWAKMKYYNQHDVRLLEALYLRMLPWTKNHPNMANLQGKDSCTRCGSTKFLPTSRLHYASTRSYTQYRCATCGGWGRSTKSVKAAKVTHA